MSETPAPAPPHLPGLLILLSVSTGMVDAISILGLGKVFTANMTGNIVFLGFAAAGAPGFSIAPYVAALTAFLFGALLAGRIGRAHAGASLRRWLLTAALVEAALLCVAAAVATGFDVAAQSPTARLIAIIMLTGVAMGFRNGTIRQLKIPDLTTTVLTLTLTGLAADSGPAGGGNPNWARRLAGVAAIFVGAALGAALVLRLGLALPLLLTAALVLAGTLACTFYPVGRAQNA